MALRQYVVLTTGGIVRIICAMARNVAVVVTDDIDGSPNAETVTFWLGWDDLRD